MRGPHRLLRARGWADIATLTLFVVVVVGMLVALAVAR